MAKTIANCTIWLDDVAIASQVNQVSIDVSAAELDVTTFANAGQARLAGLLDGVISVAGLWEAAPDPDATFFADVGKYVPVTVAMARNAAAGAVAYFMHAEIAEYKGIGAKVGNPLAFSLKAAQKDRDYSGTTNTGARLAQGVLAENRTVTTSGNGNVYGPLPAPVIQQAIAAVAHVTAVSGTGPSLTLTLRSSASNAMTSPTTRLTFGPFGSTGSACGQVDGSITDTYWQFIWTVSGTTPSFTFAASLGNAY
jgi:hypothetical protein